MDTYKNEITNNYALKSEIPTTADQVGARASTWMPNLNDVSYLGKNIIETQDQDTTQSWAALGSGYAWYNTSGLLVDQPSQYGFILNYSYSTEIFQIWNALPGGATYFRSGNKSGWSNGWRRVFDSKNTPYPVGSIYMSANSTSPASLFGGTWEQLKDRFLLGAGSTYSNGSTGGSATVTLDNTQIPNHSHKIARGDTAAGSTEFPANSISILNSACQVMSAAGKRYISLTGTNATNGGGSHNNMPPYLTVYMWKRVS